MRYVMALDGGGTKLNCLIADENGNLVGVGRGGPTNPNYSTRMNIEESILTAVSGALTAGGMDTREICTVNATLIIGEQWPTDLLKKLLHKNVSVCYLNEMAISLYGAIQEEYGGLALAGTGSFASVRTEKDWVFVGGWGNAFGDEGSGYYIGQKALRVCAQIEDGIIPHSLIWERVKETYKIRNMREMIAQLNQALPGRQRTLIASVCPIAGWCADQGDEAAIDIFKKAAFHLARQLKTAEGRCGKYDIPVTVAGGAWKATPVFFAAFKEEFKKQLPLSEVKMPLFEPVVGGILLGLRDMGYEVKENIGILKKNFIDFVYDERFLWPMYK